jgi:hypothetical protein
MNDQLAQVQEIEKYSLVCKSLRYCFGTGTIIYIEFYSSLYVEDNTPNTVFWINALNWVIQDKKSKQILTSENVDDQNVSHISRELNNQKLLSITIKDSNQLILTFETLNLKVSITEEEKEYDDPVEFFMLNGGIYYWNSKGLFKSEEVDEERCSNFKHIYN